MARLTIREAAAMTGLSDRTIRRRVKDGELPAQIVQRNGQDVWQIDPGDLAAWAQATGTPLQDPGHEVTGAGEVQAAGDPATRGQSPAEVVNALQVQLDAARQALQEVQAERDWLRAHVDGLTRALPAPATAADRDEPRRPWWRFWGAGRDG